MPRDRRRDSRIEVHITLDKSTRSLLERLVDVLAPDVDKLKAALSANETETAVLKDTVDKNAPKA
jgi:hypothetical protein